jgi:hypothetical protein
MTTELEMANRLSTQEWTIRSFSEMGGYWWVKRESSGTRVVKESDIPWQNLGDRVGHNGQD